MLNETKSLPDQQTGASGGETLNQEENNRTLNDILVNSASNNTQAPDSTGIYPSPDPNSTMGSLTEGNPINPEIKFDEGEFAMDRKKKIIKIVMLIVLFLSLGANGALAYLTLNKDKTIKSQKSTIDSKTEESKKLKVVVDSKSNCPVTAAPAPAATAEAAPAAASTSTTTKKKSTGTGSSSSGTASTTSSSTVNSEPAAVAQEEVIAPPPPPSD